MAAKVEIDRGGGGDLQFLGFYNFYIFFYILCILRFF